MAHAITDYADYASPNPASGLFARLARNVADYREFLGTVAELNAYSDRQLADLGIARPNIRDVAHEAVYGG